MKEVVTKLFFHIVAYIQMHGFKNKVKDFVPCIGCWLDVEMWALHIKVEADGYELEFSVTSKYIIQFCCVHQKTDILFKDHRSKIL